MGNCELQFNGNPAKPIVEVMLESSSILPQARTTLTTRAARWNADYLLWIDADHSFPEDGLLRLLIQNKDIIGVNYPRRLRPTWPTAHDEDGKPVWTTPELAQAGLVEEVGTLGFGFCLVSMNVIDDLAGSGRPLYAMGVSEDFTRYVGEDAYFCATARRAGYKIHLDHGLSWQIGHVSRTELFNQDAVDDRRAYEASGIS
jgi:hypothetical protein